MWAQIQVGAGVANNKKGDNISAYIARQTQEELSYREEAAIAVIKVDVVGSMSADPRKKSQSASEGAFTGRREDSQRLRTSGRLQEVMVSNGGVLRGHV